MDIGQKALKHNYKSTGVFFTLEIEKEKNMYNNLGGDCYSVTGGTTQNNQNIYKSIKIRQRYQVKVLSLLWGKRLAVGIAFGTWRR